MRQIDEIILNFDEVHLLAKAYTKTLQNLLMDCNVSIIATTLRHYFAKN